MHSEDFPALPGTATKASGKLSLTSYDVFTLTELRLLYIFRKKKVDECPNTPAKKEFPVYFKLETLLCFLSLF